MLTKQKTHDPNCKGCEFILSEPFAIGNNELKLIFCPYTYNLIFTANRYGSAEYTIKNLSCLDEISIRITQKEREKCLELLAKKQQEQERKDS